MNRRDVFISVAVAALLAAGFVATRRDPQPGPDAAPSPGPVTTASPGVDQAPAPGQEDLLPWRDTALPRQITIEPMTSVPLATDPVGRALALFQVSLDTGGPYEELGDQVYVLGDDGQLRRLDVPLVPTVDAGGHPHSAFGAAVLKPDGTRVAFPQPDHVLLVDLTTATARKVPVPGRNLRTLWMGEHLLVTQPDATVEVDPLSGRVTPRPYAGAAIVAGLAQGAPVVGVVKGAGVWSVRTWADSSAPAGPPIEQLPRNAELSEPGWAHRYWVALDYRSFEDRPVPEFTDRSESVLVFDANTATAVGRLVLTSDGAAARSPGCCAVQGWLDERGVLLDVPGQDRWILAWDPVTGKVQRVARITFRGARLAMSLVDGAYL